jgi:hypothetical protein
MKYDPGKHHRRSIRIHGYDYAQSGAYFVTICAQERQCLFGEIVGGEMHLIAAWSDFIGTHHLLSNTTKA